MFTDENVKISFKKQKITYHKNMKIIPRQCDDDIRYTLFITDKGEIDAGCPSDNLEDTSALWWSVMIICVVFILITLVLSVVFSINTQKPKTE